MTGGAQAGGATAAGGAATGGAVAGGTGDTGGAVGGGAAAAGGAANGGAANAGAATGGDTDPSTPPTIDPSTPGTSGGSGDVALSGGAVSGGNNTDVDTVANRPVEQAKPKDELAATGAGDTTLLMVGAATMIAGGVAFRFLPLLGGRGGNAA
ncbi:hypothetical protein ACQPZG_21765 [Streptomyces sp. CA-294286]|uniref:hypothetical protein n=1 Tax=Streptomyces sp. CA-294286 TaxID=3240070 RepID=UPI003D90FD85